MTLLVTDRGHEPGGGEMGWTIVRLGRASIGCLDLTR
jgi:hypothetical protein